MPLFTGTIETRAPGRLVLVWAHREFGLHRLGAGEGPDPVLHRLVGRRVVCCGGVAGCELTLTRWHALQSLPRSVAAGPVPD